MTDDLRETPDTDAHPTATPDPWDTFRLRLAAYLSRMTDPADRLVLQIPGDSLFGPTPYAQISGSEHGRSLRIELASGDVWERPAAEASQVARLLTVAVRDEAMLPHPQLLTALVEGPAATAAAVLGLDLSTDVATGLAGTESFAMPADRDAVMVLAQEWLTERYGPQIDDGVVPIDEDGDFVLSQYGQTFWVRVRKDQPTVDVFTCLVPQVRSVRQATLEVGLLNRDHLWTRWAVRGGGVFLHVVVPGRPWVPETMDTMLDHFLDSVQQTRDDLRLRVGGRADR